VCCPAGAIELPEAHHTARLRLAGATFVIARIASGG
jgi:hypothetical protein